MRLGIRSVINRIYDTMTSEISKLKSLYLKLDSLQAAGEDVVAELKKEINNLELTYLKKQVLPLVAQFIASKVRDLRCGIDSSFQFDGNQTIDYSFCTSGSMLLVKDSIDINSIVKVPEVAASLDEKHRSGSLFPDSCFIQTPSGADIFAGYKRYLSTLTSNTGRRYSASSINVYVSALRSKYMQVKVSKFAGTPNLELVSDLSIIDKIIYEVKYEADCGMVNKSSYLALKMFRNYLSLNPIDQQSATKIESVPAIQNPKPETTPRGKAFGILSIDAEHIHVAGGKLDDMFAIFLNEIGPELVYDMKINYMGTNLIDTNENPFYADAYVKLNGGFWVNVSPNPETVANQIRKICENLGMDVSVTMNQEVVSGGYSNRSRSRTMYSLNGGYPLNKRKTVLEVVRLYVKTHPSATFQQLVSAFPKSLQGTYGVIASLSVIRSRIRNGYDDEYRYYLDIDKILRSSDGVEFAVCNQWGHQFAHFQAYVQRSFNWTIEEV